MENTSSTGGTILTQPLNLATVIHLVEAQHSKLHLLLLVLQLLGLGVRLLLALLTATTQTEHQVKSRLLLNVVIGKGASILQLLAREDQALLVWRDPFFILDLCLDIVDGVRGLHLKSDGFPREGFNENLHTH